VSTERHHIWCNFFTRPREGCKQCEGLYAKYPMGGLTPTQLQQKHFPEAIPRTTERE
jgi:hypothetical protein